MSLLFSLAALATAFYFLQRSMGFLLLSPVYVFITTYTLVFGFGGLLYDPRYGGTSVRIRASPHETYALCVQMSILLCFFVLGSALWARRKQMPAPQGLASGIKPKAAQACLIFAVFVIVLLLIGNGFGNVISRDVYMVEEFRSIKSISEAILPAAVISLGAASSTKDRLARVNTYLIALAIAILDLALSKRQLASVPILFFAGMYFTARKKGLARAGIVTSIVLCPFLLVLPLTSRGMNHQGLASLPALAEKLTRLDWHDEARAMLNNLFISAPLTTLSANTPVDDPVDYALLGVNPLPGFMTRWKELGRSINEATPFNTPGDLLRAGFVFGAIYYALLGCYFTHVHYLLINAQRLGGFHFALAALSYLYALSTLQYPLRSCTRLVYYMIAIELCAFIARDLTSRRRPRSKLTPSYEITANGPTSYAYNGPEQSRCP